MCLAVPKQVISIKRDFIVVNSKKGKQQVGTIIKVKKNDWVLTQNDIIIRKINLKQVKEIKGLLRNTDQRGYADRK